MWVKKPEGVERLMAPPSREREQLILVSLVSRVTLAFLGGLDVMGLLGV
jgi:hypothetical protein